MGLSLHWVCAATLPSSSATSRGLRAPHLSLQASSSLAAKVIQPPELQLGGRFITLMAGSVRQLHWHPYADEWAYVVKGSFVVTITGPQDDPWPQSVSVAPEGSIWFFPKGWWHVILCQTDECELVLAFNNKAFIGKDDLDFAQAMLTLPGAAACVAPAELPLLAMLH